jgi:hypothetical protein
MRNLLMTGGLVLALCVTARSQQLSPLAADELPDSFLLTTSPHTAPVGSIAAGGVLGHRSTGGVLGVDSLQNWSSYFYEPGLDSNGFLQFTWQYTMVGRSPFSHGDDDRNSRRDDDREGQTWIPAPIVPVTIDLRDAAGNPRLVNGHPLVATSEQFIDPVLKSPVFSFSSFTSSFRPTQVSDAVQRAEFFNVASDGWHTLLRPRVAAGLTMTLRQSTDPVNHPVYQFARNADGTCCRFILVNIDAFVNALFPPTATDTSTVMGAAENSHRITTQDLSTFLFNNVFLFFNANKNPNDCCVLGFHSYDVEPGDKANGFRERRYVMDYASWISPGLFGTAFTDVTALSHEISEIYNDPFGNNFTPWWLSPNGNCQNDLEDGDVVEGLPDATVPIALNGFTYHPQNEALLQWFAGVTPSTAINHAYSYPDTTVLTSANIPQRPNCTPPIH